MIGRNDPCHCGSGNKYKRCCLERDQAKERNGLRLVHSESATPAAGRSKPDHRKPNIRTLIDNELDWGNYHYAKLAHHLVNSMESSYDEDLILGTVMLWYEFSTEVKPIFQKYGVYCAALEYLVADAHGFPVTQADLAAKYGVSAGSVSKRFQELLNYTDGIEVDEDMDEDEFHSLTNMNRMEMERGMRQLENAMQGQTFDTIEDAEAFVNQWMSKQNSSAPRAARKDKREEAQELVYKAESTSSSSQRIRLAKEAIELYPNSPDAYRILAENAKNPLEVTKYLKQGVDAGERDLGKAFFKENRGYFWGVVETRPYMRVKYAYAENCWLNMDMQGAAKQLEELLELNPMDNMGARDLLLAVYLEMRSVLKVEKLIERYSEDHSAVFAYSELIMEYLRHGLTPKLTTLYNTAKKRNKHIPNYLFGKRKLPSSLPEYVGYGDENEAVMYIAYHSRVWADLPELTQWLAARR